MSTPEEQNTYYRKLAIWAGYALAALATIAANALIQRWLGPSAPAVPAPPPPVIVVQPSDPEAQFKIIQKP